MAKFRVTVFDPVLLLAQMLACQACYYLVAGTAAVLFGALLGAGSSAWLNVLFDYRELSTETAIAWIAAAAYLVSAAVGYAAAAQRERQRCSAGRGLGESAVAQGEGGEGESAL